MAIEKLNIAAKEAQARVNSMNLTTSLWGSYLGSCSLSCIGIQLS